MTDKNGSNAVSDEPDYNREHLNYHRGLPRPDVKGRVIDFHSHLLAARHGEAWFQAADHFGIDAFVTMAPLEEAAELKKRWGDRLRFIVVPNWMYTGPDAVDDWLHRLDGLYNLGSRLLKFHMAPRSLDRHHWDLESPRLKPIFDEVVARKMGIMTHVGDPDIWYSHQYADAARYGTRELHYAMWERTMQKYPDIPWVGAHLGGNPEDPQRLQGLLDRYPNLMLDCSATRWMAREVSRHHQQMRDFFIRNADRLLFGSDQVSGDDRGFDFLASRLWVHRKLWESDYVGPSPILDPDVPADQQVPLHGLHLPQQVLQKLYHDNAIKLLARLGMGFDEPA